MTSPIALVRERVLARMRSGLSQELRRLPDIGTLDDPVLQTLMRLLATEVATVQTEQEKVRDGLLDELMTGLGVQPRRPIPAQTVLSAKVTGRLSYHVPAGYKLIADTPSRQEFRTDDDLWISGARITAAFAYSNRTLSPFTADIYESGRESPDRAEFEPCGLNWGPEPQLLLAIEDLPNGDPSGLSLYLQTDDVALQNSLRTSVWRLSESRGEFLADGILRVVPGRRGTGQLHWAVEARARRSQGESESGPYLTPGRYSHGLFQFPRDAPPDNFQCGCPRTVKEAFARSKSRASLKNDDFLRRPRLWVRISLGTYAGDPAQAVQRLRLHVVSASNLILIDRSHTFSTQGRSFPADDGEGATRFAVSVNSLIGGRGGHYADAYQSLGNPGDGRYFLRRRRLDIEPATTADGTEEEPNVTISLWMTDGPGGNAVPAGKLRAEVKENDGSSFQIESCLVSRGGSDGEGAADAQRRFSAAILTRGRIVTEADVRAVSRAFDDRITDVTVEPGLERTPRGLQRVYRVAALLNDRFASGEPEWMQLVQELEDHLQSLAALDVVVRVRPVWDTEAAAEAPKTGGAGGRS